MDNSDYTTWLEIDLQAIQNNIKELKRISGRPLMAVVKANAYGHGLTEVGLATEAAGADWCGVSRIEEGILLRQAGFKKHILVLGYTPPSRAVEASNENISLTVYDVEVVKAYSKSLQGTEKTLKVQVKIDSGMGRLGIFPEEGVDFIRWLKTIHSLKVEGVFTHFACADEPTAVTTDNQMDQFLPLVDELQKLDLKPDWVHACNSAAALYFPRARLDMVRTGIAIYGLHPSQHAPLPPGFKPALSFKAKLLSVKFLPPGQGISYGHRYKTQGTEQIGVIGDGYADGFRRVAGNIALVQGKKVPVIGNICMDQLMLQLDSVPNAKIGDEVVLIGRQGQSVISVEDVAQAWGTINYEVVCGMANRLPRLYV